MHGVSRKAPSVVEREALSLKAAKLGDLKSQLLHLHRSKIYTKEAIDVSSKLLESNPEHYTCWNYRKLAVQHFLKTAPHPDSILDEELRINALKTNFKSYGAWHHRKWILSKGHSSTDQELQLLGKFQKLDSRNFHAWNYRRFITALRKIPDEEELKYTEDMIYDNFSNYSAWHNRSVLLSHLLEARKEGFNDKEIVLGQEFDFVRNALFTDPDDQSGWFYHLWLLEQTLKQEPQLLASWPPLGSTIYLSVNDFLVCQSSLPVLHFQSKNKKFPVILCFSEAVEGINWSTVTVECEYHACDDLIWEPLSEDKFGFAKTWLTFLNYPSEVNSIKAYPVKISFANVPGVASSSRIFSSTYNISFTVCVPSHDQVHLEVQTKKFSWKEEVFRTYDAHPNDSNLLHLLNKLKIIAENNTTTSDWSIKAISTEIAHCRELLSCTNCKIGKLTLARVLMAYNTLISRGRPNDGIETHYEEILSLYRNLMMMDPAHLCYYEDGYSIALLKQVTSNMKFLLKYGYQVSNSLSTRSSLCLRLNNLSISRIGSMECLLWVQMLDLSHNKLRSLEGLMGLVFLP